MCEICGTLHSLLLSLSCSVYQIICYSVYYNPRYTALIVIYFVAVLYKNHIFYWI